jgi:alkaline phosphatase
MFKKRSGIRTLLTMTGCAALFLAAAASAFGPMYGYYPKDFHGKNRVKNVIVLVPDGCDATVQTISRWYKGDKLAVDELTSGAVRTWMTNSIIPGSAAAATAFATGFKSEEPFIGVGPSSKNALSTYKFPLPQEYLSYRPLASVLEAAKFIGKSTGLVATSTISHATPAGFSAHVHSRSDEFGIIEHQVYQNMDVVFGGGKNKLVARTDGENLKDTLVARGYKWVETRDEMFSHSSGKVWGLFAGEALQPEIDRAEFGPLEPSLAEMTRKAIDLLSQNHRGFFLMVEGSQVDWAGHNNDPIYMITDFLAFDEAVRTAVEFAQADGQTAVLAFPDHNTGGMTLGSYFSDRRVSYDRMPVEHLVDPLKGMKLSSIGVAGKIYNKNDPAEIISAVQTWWGITLADADVNEILSWPHSTSFNYRLASVVSKNFTAIGWTTHGHNGEDVPLWTYNCDLSGTIENTDIAAKIFDLFGVNSTFLNEQLFVDVDDVFSGGWSIDNSVAANPVLVITEDAMSFRLPISKDELHYVQPAFSGFKEKAMKIPLRGLVVYAPKTGRVYIPNDAVKQIRMVSRMF